MTEPPIILAVYGTLRRGERNEPYLAGAAFLGTAVVLGRLHEMPRSDLREYPYPALVDGQDRVAVELYRLPDEVALASIDELESYDPADEDASQYVRRSAAIVDGPVATAWAYVYNGPRNELGHVIHDGDWVAFRLREEGGPLAR